MAFASVGSLGATADKTANKTSMNHAVTAAAEVGNLVVVIVSSDNDGTQSGNEHTSMTSGSNTFTKAGEFSGSAVAQGNGTISIWFCKITSQINNAANITVNFANATNFDAAAMTAWEFTIDTTKNIQTEGTAATNADLTAALDVTTANIECLRIRGVYDESGNNAMATGNATASWTEFTGAVTAGGGAASNMCVGGEWIISTGTGSSSDPTWVASGDNGSLYVALKEVTPPSGPSNAVKTGVFIIL